MNVRADGIQLEVIDAYKTKDNNTTITHALVKSVTLNLDGASMPFYAVNDYRHGEKFDCSTFDARLNMLCLLYCRGDLVDNLVRIEMKKLPRSIRYGYCHDDEHVHNTDDTKAPVYFLILDSLDLALRLDNSVGEALFKQITSIRDIKGGVKA